jgi:hypothetical protein
MDKQSGGVKLKPEKSIAFKSVRGKMKTESPTINIKKDGFTPVYNMVNNDSSQMSVLTVDSLKGFMINLTVNEQDTEYLNLRGTQFTNPVTNFILKFVILRGTNDVTPLQSYNNIHKSFESRKSYFEEAKLQQFVWSKSIIDGRPAICPSVANFALFDTVNSKTLMEFFLDKVNPEPSTTTASSEPPLASSEPTLTSSEPTTPSVFDFLLDNSTINDRGIGLLTMPAITQSTTLESFLTLHDGDNFYGEKITHEIKSHVISSVFAQIARLFIEIEVIHLDLHPGNIMVYLDSDKKILKPIDKIKTLLIDFGRASNINNNVKDVLSIEDKNEAMEIKKIYYARFGKMIHSTSPDEKRKYIENVLDTVAEADFFIHQLHYKDGRTYQMMWYSQYRKYYQERDFVIRQEYANLFVNAFDILKDMMKANIESPGITPTTIKTYQRNGSLVNFNSPIEKFIVPFPGPATPPAQARPLDPEKIQYRVQMDTLPPPLVQTEPISPSGTDVSLQSSVSVYPPPPPTYVAPPDNNIDANSLPFSANMETEDNIDANSLPSSEPKTSLLPPTPHVDNVLRVQGGRKNKLHKTNKRKKCKSKKNKRNKNTRKKN